MTIRCPSCSAAAAWGGGDLPAAGRMVACTACGTRWLARPFRENPFSRLKPFPVAPDVPDVSDAIVLDDEPPVAATAPRRPRPAVVAAPPPRSPFPWIAGGVTGIGALAVAVAVLVAGAFPGAGRSAASVKLDFQKVRTETMQLGGVPSLLVEGEVVNRTAREMPVPAIQVTLKTPEGQSVRTWLVEPAITGLAPGKTAGFRSVLASPPAHATQVTLNLAERQRSKPQMRW